VRRAAHHDRERSRPARAGQRARGVVDVDRPVVELRGVAEVHDHRMVGRTALDREQPVHRVGRRRVGPEAVDRFGGERHQAAVAQHAGGASDVCVAHQ